MTVDKNDISFSGQTGDSFALMSAHKTKPKRTIKTIVM